MASIPMTRRLSISKERKEAILASILGPEQRSVAQAARDENINLNTLYSWKRQAVMKGKGMDKSKKSWSSSEKFHIVLECASLSEAQLAEYCRRNGLYPEQIKRWREICEKANLQSTEQVRETRRIEHLSQKKIRKLEQEIRRKDKALAEASALLILSKKVQAIWEEEDE